MDDLLAQLDSRDQTVQSESASVLNEMEVVKQAQSQDEETTRKKDPKQRFLARQVRLPFPPPSFIHSLTSSGQESAGAAGEVHS